MRRRLKHSTRTCTRSVDS